MGLFDFLKSKPSTEHKSSAPKRRQPDKVYGEIQTLWELPRRKSLLAFVDANKWHLTRNKFTYKTAAKRIGGSKADVYHLIQSKYYLFAMCKKMRAYCGEPVKGYIGEAPQCEPVIATNLKKLACPTAILGILARAIEKDGMEKAQGVLRFLERSYARPDSYAGELLTLADRYDMVPPPPAA